MIQKNYNLYQGRKVDAHLLFLSTVHSDSGYNVSEQRLANPQEGGSINLKHL